MKKTLSKKIYRENGGALLFALIMSSIFAIGLVALNTYLEQNAEYNFRNNKVSDFTEIISLIKMNIEPESFCNQSSTGILDRVRANNASRTSISDLQRLVIESAKGGNLTLRPGWVHPNKSFKITRMQFIPIMNSLRHIPRISGNNPIDFGTNRTFSRATNRPRGARLRTQKGLYRLIVTAHLCSDFNCRTQPNSIYIHNGPKCMPNSRRFSFNSSQCHQRFEPYERQNIRNASRVFKNAYFGKKTANTLDVMLFLHFDRANGRYVKSCFGIESVAQLCESSGYIWNPYPHSLVGSINNNDYRVKEFQCEPHIKCYRSFYNYSTNRCGAADLMNARYIRQVLGNTEDGSFLYGCFWCNPNFVDDGP